MRSLLLILSLALLVAAGGPQQPGVSGGDGGLVNLPGGGSMQLGAPVRHVVDQVAVLSLHSGRFVVLGPAEQSALNAGQQLTSTWVDNEGVEHTVTTDVGSPSQIHLYIKRHDNLVQAYKALYPPAIQEDPRTGGEVLSREELRRISREEQNQSRNWPPADPAGRLRPDNGDVFREAETTRDLSDGR